MGQRLIINVKGSDDRDFRFTTYFHWSAYTNSAISLTLKFIEAWENKYRRMKGLCQNDRLLLCAIEAWPGSGIVEGDANEIALADAGFPKFALANGGVPKGLDRNEGLIAVSEYESEKLISWEEGRVDIHVSKAGAATIWFDVWYIHDLNDEDASGDDYITQKMKSAHRVADCPAAAKSVRDLLNGEDVKPDELRTLGRLFEEAYDNGWHLLFPNEGLFVEAIA